MIVPSSHLLPSLIFCLLLIVSLNSYHLLPAKRIELNFFLQGNRREFSLVPATPPPKMHIIPPKWTIILVLPSPLPSPCISTGTLFYYTYVRRACTYVIVHNHTLTTFCIANPATATYVSDQVLLNKSPKLIARLFMDLATGVIVGICSAIVHWIIW